MTREIRNSPENSTRRRKSLKSDDEKTKILIVFTNPEN